MIRRLLRAALPAASLLVLVVAGSARADDAPGQKTYALARKSAWRVGDVVTTTTVEAETKKTKETKETLAGDPEAPERVVETKTTAVAVSQCLAAADDGAWTKMLVYVKEWTRTSGDKRDESLKGARVEVASQGREGRWVLAGNSPKPSREGAEWLDRHFGAKSTDEGSLVKALLPKDPVSVGATWDGDAVLLFATSALGSVADPAKSTVKGTLRSVDATSARVGVEISLSLTSLPGLPSAQRARQH